MYLSLNAHRNSSTFLTFTDNGNFWKSTVPASKGLSSGVPVTNERKPNRVSVINVTDMLLWESSDAGNRWVSRGLSVSGGWTQPDEVWRMGSSYQGLLHTIDYRAKSPSTLLWVINQFVYKSTSSGAKWADSVTCRVRKDMRRSRDIDNVVPLDISVSLADAKLVYVGYADLGLWRSTDAGALRKSLNKPKFTSTDQEDWRRKGGNWLMVDADPSRKNVVWAHLTGNIVENGEFLLKSTNREDNWSVTTKVLLSSRTYIESLDVARDSPK